MFGQVYRGMEVVDAINAVKTDDNERPLEEVQIQKVTVSTYDPAADAASSAAASSAAPASDAASSAVSSSSAAA